MVCIQHLLSMLQIQIILGHVVPWQIQHEFDVIVLHAVFRGRRIVFLELGQFFFELGGHFLRPLLLLRLLAELIEFLIIIHSQLFLDGTKLVVQVILPLLLIYVAFHLLVNLLLDFKQLGLRLQQP